MDARDLWGRHPQGGDADRVWVLTVDYRGEVLRWVSRDVEITGLPTGSALEPGLDGMELTRTLEQGDQRGRSISLDLPWSGDLAAAEADGVHLAGSPVELALLPTSGGVGAWRDRRVALLGYASRPEWGDVDELVTLTLEPYDRNDRALFPPATARVDEDTWPSAPDKWAGRVYPFPFGKAGDLGDEYVPATPGVVVADSAGTGGDRNADTLLVAYGHTVATQVHLWHQVGDDNERMNAFQATLTKTVDSLGQRVTVVDLTGYPDAIRRSSEWWCDWRYGEAVSASRSLGTLGGLASFMLGRSTLPVDYGLLNTGIVRLQDVPIAGFVDETTGPVDWIVDRLLGDLPLRLVHGPAGAYLEALVWRATARDAAAHLEVGDGSVVRAGRLRTTHDGRATEVRVRWGYNLARDTWRRVTVVRSDRRGDLTDVLEVDSGSPRSSSADHVTEVDLPDCYSADTAYLVARWLLWRDGTPHAELALDVDADRWGWLQEGEVVTVTDASISWDAQTCRIERVPESDAAWWSLRVQPIEAP